MLPSKLVFPIHFPLCKLFESNGMTDFLGWFCSGWICSRSAVLVHTATRREQYHKWCMDTRRPACLPWNHSGKVSSKAYSQGYVLMALLVLTLCRRHYDLNAKNRYHQKYYLLFQGDILVMDLHGNMVGKSNLKPGVAITEMAWNCERFNMEEQSGSNENGQQNLNIFPPTSNNAQQPKQPQPYLRPDGNV